MLATHLKAFHFPAKSNYFVERMQSFNVASSTNARSLRDVSCRGRRRFLSWRFQCSTLRRGLSTRNQKFQISALFSAPRIFLPRMMARAIFTQSKGTKGMTQAIRDAQRPIALPAMDMPTMNQTVPTK